jgi:hypothetical protein
LLPLCIFLACYRVNCTFYLTELSLVEKRICRSVTFCNRAELQNGGRTVRCSRNKCLVMTTRGKVSRKRQKFLLHRLNYNPELNSATPKALEMRWKRELGKLVSHSLDGRKAGTQTARLLLPFHPPTTQLSHGLQLVLQFHNV